MSRLAVPDWRQRHTKHLSEQRWNMPSTRLKGKMMKGLKVHKAAGQDSIGHRILTTLAPSIASIPTIIFQRAYDTGLILHDWRNANVVPVYKKGKWSVPSNYRPISLTCVTCKLMEHIVTSHIMWHASHKCQVFIFTRKWQPVTYNYIPNRHQLEHVSDAKYLGITFTNDMR